MGAVFEKMFNRTFRDIIKRPVLEQGDGTWIDTLPKMMKQHNNRIHPSAKITPIQGSLKKNERYVY